jgi:hypothetical protein
MHRTFSQSIFARDRIVHPAHVGGCSSSEVGWGGSVVGELGLKNPAYVTTPLPRFDNFLHNVTTFVRFSRITRATRANVFHAFHAIELC